MIPDIPLMMMYLKNRMKSLFLQLVSVSNLGNGLHISGKMAPYTHTTQMKVIGGHDMSLKYLGYEYDQVFVDDCKSEFLIPKNRKQRRMEKAMKRIKVG